jgi:hypothetical protein
MPCYLFNYHAHGSWMPDHRREYVKRHKGILPPDTEMAARYRANMTQDVVLFDTMIQRHLIEESLSAGGYRAMIRSRNSRDPNGGFEKHP